MNMLIVDFSCTYTKKEEDNNKQIEMESNFGLFLMHSFFSSYVCKDFSSRDSPIERKFL